MVLKGSIHTKLQRPFFPEGEKQVPPPIEITPEIAARIALEEPLVPPKPETPAPIGKEQKV